MNEYFIAPKIQEKDIQIIKMVVIDQKNKPHNFIDLSGTQISLDLNKSYSHISSVFLYFFYIFFCDFIV